jgi:hypothetical protein
MERGGTRPCDPRPAIKVAQHLAPKLGLLSELRRDPPLARRDKLLAWIHREVQIPAGELERQSHKFLR